MRKHPFAVFRAGVHLWTIARRPRRGRIVLALGAEGGRGDGEILRSRSARAAETLALLAALLFGSATPIGKSHLAGLSPFHLAGLLYLGAAVGLAPPLLLEGR